MKTPYYLALIALLLLASIAANAQTFVYTYDASGNRIKREIPQTMALQNGQNPLTEQTVQTAEMLKTMETETLVPIQDSLNQDAFKLLLYPNPTTGTFTLELPELKAGEQGNLIIYSIIGHTLVQQKVSQPLQLFNIRGAMPGYYMVRVTIGDKIVSKTLVKQ